MQKRSATGVGLGLRSLACGLCALAMSAVGCVERDPFSASDVAAADAFQASQAASASAAAAATARGGTGNTVKCACDAEGGLHVQAPRGAAVKVTEGGDDAEAEITMPSAERPPGTRIRQTVSLGYAGDGKLTEIPSRNRPSSEPDRPVGYAVYGYPGYGYGYPSYGYPSYGRIVPGYANRAYTGSRGYASHGPRSPGARGSGGSSGGAQSGGSLIFSPHVHASGVAGGHASGGSRGSASPGGSRGPR